MTLAGCPYGLGRHDDDDRGGNRGRVDQQQGPERDHPDDGRHDDGNQRPGSDRDHHDDDSGPDHQ